jgi:short-subunit dehydrogenase
VMGDVGSDDSMKQVICQVQQWAGKLDVVVANAGFGVTGEVEKLDLEDYRRQFETNIFGVLRTVKATLPFLKESRGRLAVIGSVNGYVALPGNSPYAMSKFAVRALCDALYYELLPFGISVTHIAPGFVTSEIRRINNRGELRETAKDPIPQWLQMRAPIAAKKIAKAISRRQRERVITGHGWWIVRLYRFFPELVFKLVRRFNIKARSEPQT